MDYISCCSNIYVWQKPKKTYLVHFWCQDQSNEKNHVRPFCDQKCQFWIQKLTKNQSLFYLKTDTILILMDYISCCPNKYVWQKPKKIYLVLFGVERPKKWKKSILFQKTGHNRKYVFSAHKILLATTWPWIFIIKIDWDKWVAWKNLVSSCW